MRGRTTGRMPPTLMPLNEEVPLLSRRTMLLTPLALAALRGVSSAQGRMTLAMHQNTSSGAGYRGSLEGWARAGIRHVELNAGLVDDFLTTDSLAAARRVLTDNGLTPVSGSVGVGRLWEPNPDHDTALDTLRARCEMFAELGLERVYASTGTNGEFTEDDYDRGIENMRMAGDVAREFDLIMMIEFIRNSTFISTLTTTLRMTRAAGNVSPMLDFYHFLSGLSGLEDLDLIRPGEIAHVHFQDVPDIPRELLTGRTRAIPGDGIAPVSRVLQTLADKGYTGALSVELFLYQQVDPYELAVEIREKAEPVMRDAGVL
jgi:2-keto-myo-inositol isomerase